MLSFALIFWGHYLDGSLNGLRAFRYEEFHRKGCEESFFPFVSSKQRAPCFSEAVCRQIDTAEAGHQTFAGRKGASAESVEGENRKAESRKSKGFKFGSEKACAQDSFPGKENCKGHATYSSSKQGRGSKAESGRDQTAFESQEADTSATATAAYS